MEVTTPFTYSMTNQLTCLEKLPFLFITGSRFILLSCMGKIELFIWFRHLKKRKKCESMEQEKYMEKFLPENYPR